MSDFPTVAGFIRLFEEFEKTPVTASLFQGEHGACALGVLGLRDGLSEPDVMTRADGTNPFYAAPHSLRIAIGFDAGLSGYPNEPQPWLSGPALAALNLGYAVGAYFYDKAHTPVPAKELVHV